MNVFTQQNQQFQHLLFSLDDRNYFFSIFSHETEDILEEEEDLLDETPFSLPIYAKPLPLLGHPSRHSVLNR